MTKDEALRNRVKPSQVGIESGSKFIGATFLYMIAALAITGVVAAICGLLLEKFVYTGNEEGAGAFGVVLLIALLLYIPTLLWVQFSALRNGRTMGPAFVFYSAIMGIFLSTFTAFIPFYEIAITFGITCLAFAGMALIAWGSKRNVSSLAVIASGIMMGALLIFLFNFLFSLFFPEVFEMIYWVVSFAIFFAIILITIVDLNNVKRIAQNGGAGKNIALLCAFNLYVDFIYIFIRILVFVVNTRRR